MAQRDRLADGTRPSASGGGRHRRRRWLLPVLIMLAILLLAALAVPVAIYTERPAFCPVCHEMRPYYDAWAAGPHTAVSCVDCHVDAGVVNHALHKFVALREVWDHFTRENVFPSYTVELPNRRCEPCHRSVRDDVKARFSHDVHSARAQCKECHPTTGHAVTLEALDKAGVLRADATAPPIPVATPASSVAGHLRVTCQQCHDQVRMRCDACHTAPHDVRPGDCSACHRPGASFAFVHPADTACAKCHAAPKRHYGTACASCHSPAVPFAKAVFRHRGDTGEHSYKSFPCVKCHPRGYGSASCTCHGGGRPSGD